MADFISIDKYITFANKEKNFWQSRKLFDLRLSHVQHKRSTSLFKKIIESLWSYS